MSQQTDDGLSDRWLTAEEAGQYTGYSAWSIRRFSAEGLIRHFKAPGRTGGYRYKKRWLDDFMEARVAAPKLQPPPKPKLRPVKSPQERVAAVRAKLKQMKD